MGRMLTSYLLMLTTLTGPWVCCCTGERLVKAAHRIADWCGASKLERPVPTCCGNHHSSTGKSKDSQPPLSKLPVPGQDKCPCKTNAPDWNSERGSDSLSFQEGLRFQKQFPIADALLRPDDISSLLIAGRSDGNAGARDCPYRTSRELLSTLQILRC